MKKQKILPLVIIGVTLVIVLSFGLFYRVSSAGKATYTAIPLEPLEFVAEGEHAVDTAVPSFTLYFAPSFGEKKYYGVNLEKHTDGAVSYIVQECSAPTTCNPEALAVGRLNTQVPSSGNLFLDNDFKPDLELSVGGNLLRVRNLNFIRPETSTITLQKRSGATWVESSALLQYVPLAATEFRVKVSSAEAAPTAAIAFADAALQKTLTEISAEATATSRTYTLTFTPTSKKLYRATVTATVGGKITTKDLLFAGEGLLYQLDQTGYPKVNLSIASDEVHYQASIIFEPTLSLQTFSLPCGVNSNALSSMFDANVLKAVYSYDYDVSSNTQRVFSWLKGAPPTLTTLVPNLGYAVKFDPAGSYKVTLDCSSGFDPALSQLPTLRQGWNYVSVTGFQAVPAASVIAPPTKQVSTVYVLKKDQQYEAATQLEPGKAYWVLVE